MVSSPLSPFHSQQKSRVSKKMSVTQTYFLAHKARGKLASEAARPDHDLRLLVGHANLLDSLMLDLAEAERDQEAWFNQSIKKSTPQKTEEKKHIQWADAIPEAAEEDWEADSSDSESESDEEEDIEMADAVPLRRVPAATVLPPASPKMAPVHDIEEEDFDEEDDEEDYAALSLTRTPSHSASPPELAHDSDSSDDESMPPSPPFASIPAFSDKQGGKVTAAVYSTHDDEDQKADFYQEGYYLPPRNPARLVSAISVY